MLNLGTGVPLIFHERGVDAIYNGAHDRPLRLSAAELSGDSQGWVLEPSPGGDIGHIALFASFLLKRTQTPVEFVFNDVPVRVDSSLADSVPAELDEESANDITKRFETIDGIGVVSLDEAAEIIEVAQVATEKCLTSLGA